MNPLEIYKLLPRNNCGECTPKTCMSFAVSLGNAPGALAECRHIDPGKLSTIKSMLLKGDWRDELAGTLMDEVSKIDIVGIASDLGCSVAEDKLVIRCIGQDYTIDREGNVAPETKNKWIRILLLHYVRNMGRGEFTGKWLAFADLKGGLVKASSFLRECEEPLRQLLDAKAAAVGAAIERLGGSRTDGYSTDHAWVLDLLPKVRTLILYREADEEFSSTLNMLFDGVTGQFLDVESLMFLCEGLVHMIDNIMKHIQSTGR